MKIIVVHGPNLNLLGEREPEIYGELTLSELNKKMKVFAVQNGAVLRVGQFNGEGQIIDFIHKNRKWAEGIVINPGAYTHYSYAIRDCLAAVRIPSVEVHLSDIMAREDFRKISVTTGVCVKQISGMGWRSYTEGIKFLLERSKNAGK